MEEDEMDSCSTTYYRSSTGETRKAREFIPDSKKDEKYWERRRKNNEAAKRSREKRRQNDAMMEHEIAELKHQNEILMRENCALLREIAALKGKDPGSVVEPTTVTSGPQPPIPQIPSSVAGANGMIPHLDLVGLQRLLSAFSNNGSTVVNGGTVAAPVAIPPNPVGGSTSGCVEETPLDLSGGKIPMMLKREACLQSPNSQAMSDVNQRELLRLLILFI